jgi:hypothetical protein
MMASGKEMPLPLPKPPILQAGVKTPNGQPSGDTHKPQLAAPAAPQGSDDQRLMHGGGTVYGIDCKACGGCMSKSTLYNQPTG